MFRSKAADGTRLTGFLRLSNIAPACFPFHTRVAGDQKYAIA